MCVRVCMCVCVCMCVYVCVCAGGVIRVIRVISDLNFFSGMFLPPRSIHHMCVGLAFTVGTRAIRVIRVIGFLEACECDTAGLLGLLGVIRGY